MKYLAPALLVAAACGSSSSPSKKSPAKPAPQAAAPFTFDWSPPCRVPATETLTKDGKLETIRYDVVLTPNDDDTITVTREHVEFRQADGGPLDAPLRAEVARQERLLELLPAVIIDRDGNVVGTGDPAPYVDAMIAADPGRTPAADRAARAWMRSPAAREAVARDQTNLWSGWVSIWVGGELRPGEHIESPASEAYGEGAEGTLRIEHLGVVDGLVHLRLAQDISGAAVRAMMESTFAEVAAEMGIDLSQLDVTDVSSLTEFEIVTDPGTLRPARAMTHIALKVQTRDGKPLGKDERHQTTFDWAHATGCEAP